MLTSVAPTFFNSFWAALKVSSTSLLPPLNTLTIPSFAPFNEAWASDFSYWVFYVACNVATSPSSGPTIASSTNA